MFLGPLFSGPRARRRRSRRRGTPVVSLSNDSSIAGDRLFDSHPRRSNSAKSNPSVRGNPRKRNVLLLLPPGHWCLVRAGTQSARRGDSGTARQRCVGVHPERRLIERFPRREPRLRFRMRLSARCGRPFEERPRRSGAGYSCLAQEQCGLYHPLPDRRTAGWLVCRHPTLSVRRPFRHRALRVQ